MTEGVKQFLSQLGMLGYYDVFMAKGFDLESDIPFLTSYDLEEVLMITNQQDRAIILSHACTFFPSQGYAVYEWLRGHSLDYYFISFVQSELTDLTRIAQLTLPDEDLYDELEIVLPGHRKRLERAVAKLRQDLLRDASAERPVTFGWWGKPPCLPQAKFDFLCVKASLFADQEPHKKVSIDFMVDSGSDVSTVQEETLSRLKLELIGPVYSCGIHGGSHTNLYKARLRIGNQEMDIEVMGSNYDSLGSRVVRNFRHIIDGRRHIWLKGTGTDPLPAIASAVLPQALDLPGSLQTTTVNPSPGLRALPSTDTEDSSNPGQHGTAESERAEDTYSSKADTLTEDHSHAGQPGTAERSDTDTTVTETTPPRVKVSNETRQAASGAPDVGSSSRCGEIEAQTNIPDIHMDSQQSGGDSSGQQQDADLHTTSSPCRQELKSCSKAQLKVKDHLTRHPVKRKHSISHQDSEQAAGDEQLLSTEQDWDTATNGCNSMSQLTNSSQLTNPSQLTIPSGSELTTSYGLTAPSESSPLAPSTERVSLSNLIPADLRDTGDDIDSIGNSPFLVTSASHQPHQARELRSNRTDPSLVYHLENVPVTGQHSGLEEQTNQLDNSTDNNSNEWFWAVGGGKNNDLRWWLPSTNSCIAEVSARHPGVPKAARVCSGSVSSTAGHQSSSSCLPASLPVLSTRLDSVLTTCHDDIVHISNFGAAEDQQEDAGRDDIDSSESWPVDGADHELPDGPVRANVQMRVSLKEARDIRQTHNFIQASSGATLIPLDLLEGHSHSGRGNNTYNSSNGKINHGSLPCAEERLEHKESRRKRSRTDFS